jgi:hypothetical protein
MFIMEIISKQKWNNLINQNKCDLVQILISSFMGLVIILGFLYLPPFMKSSFFKNGEECEIWHKIDAISLIITIISVFFIGIMFLYGIKKEFPEILDLWFIIKLFAFVILFIVGVFAIIPLIRHATTHFVGLTLLFTFLVIFERWVLNKLKKGANSTNSELYIKVENLYALDKATLIAFIVFTFLIFYISKKEYSGYDGQVADILAGGAVGFHLTLSGMVSSKDFAKLIDNK